MEDSRLKTFLAVARTGSFTLAAAELDVSQSAVSQSVSALERSLGVLLFDRSKGEVALTPAGRSFSEYAVRIQHWYGAANRLFGPEGRISMEREIRLKADPVISSYLLPKVLGNILSANPGLSFEVMPADGKDALRDGLFSKSAAETADVPGTHFGTPEDADVEITLSDSPETMDFEGESRLVGVLDACLVASPLNVRMSPAAGTGGRQRPFSTLEGVHVSNRFAVWENYYAHLSPDIKSRVVLKSSSVELVKSTVRSSSDVVGIVPLISVGSDLLSGELLRMPVSLPGLSSDVHFNPLPEFAGKSICMLLKSTMSDLLSSVA